MQMNIKKYVVSFICCIILLLQMDKSGTKQLNPHPSISEIKPILKFCCVLHLHPKQDVNYGTLCKTTPPKRSAPHQKSD